MLSPETALECLVASSGLRQPLVSTFSLCVPFSAIPQKVNQNVQMVQRIFNIEQHQMETDEKIELILDKIEEIAPKQLPHKNHDRFLIIDESVYLLGASVKDMGNGLCAVTKLQTSPETILGMLK